MKWIKVEDRLPEKNVEVLGVLRGCSTGKRIQRTLVNVNESDHTWESDGYEIANCWDVTHWMPLPDPPEESE